VPRDDAGLARPTVIELMGLPAAGKTTGAALLHRGVGASSRRCVPLTETFWSAAQREAGGLLKPLLLRMPRAIRDPLMGPMTRLDLGHLFLSRECVFCEVVFREMSGLPDSRQRQSFLYALLLYAVQREAIERHSPRGLPVVAEEGFAQRAMTLFGYRPEGVDESRVAAYSRALPRPDALIWVDTAPEVCADRLARRRQPPFPLQSLPAAQWPSQLALGRRVLATVAEELRAAGVPVLALRDGADDLAEQVAGLLDTIG
jgi:hypothetical protein